MTAAAPDIAAWRQALDEAPRSNGLPAWLQKHKRDALERFTAAGFPTPRDEGWRHTNVSEIASTWFRRASTDIAVNLAELPSLDLEQGSAPPRFVVVNGRLRHELSDSAPRGVRVMDLADALPAAGQAVEARLGHLADEQGHPFAALNTALSTDIVVVIVEPMAAVRTPLHLCFVATGGAEGARVRNHPRLLVLADRHSELTLVTSHVGLGAGHYFTNAVAELAIEEGARLDLVRDQREHPDALNVSHVAVTQARDSRFRDTSLGLGGRLVRHDLAVRLANEGAECELLGLFAATGRQVMDTHSYVDHAAPHTTSRELYKGVLGGRARGVFNGHVLVRPDAQRIEAEQSNRNLLLSREALVSSTPALEIRADDVKCRHGSTTGQLDELAVFYLRSRGLDEIAARALLTRAFAGDIANRVPVASLRGVVEEHVDQLAAEVPS